MKQCQIVFHAEPIHAGQYNGPMRAVAHCHAHGVPIPEYNTDGDQKCPVGKIEQAVEGGLERIKAALGTNA
jgi:hypothetical protein